MVWVPPDVVLGGLTRLIGPLVLILALNKTRIPPATFSGRTRPVSRCCAALQI